MEDPDSASLVANLVHQCHGGGHHLLIFTPNSKDESLGLDIPKLDLEVRRDGSSSNVTVQSLNLVPKDIL